MDRYWSFSRIGKYKKQKTMNILVYSNVYLWPEHISQLIEIAKINIKKGNKVFVLTCDKSLISCPINPFHNINICKKCILQKKNITNNILESINEIPLNFEQPDFKFPKFKSLADFMNYKYDNNLPLGELVISTYSDETRNFFLNFNKIQQECLVLANNAIGLYEKARKIIQENDIQQVYVWNGRRTSCGPVLYAAKKEKREYYSYISAGSISTYVLQPTLGVHKLDYWKKNIEANYKKFGLNNKKSYISRANNFFKYMRYGQGTRSSGMPFFRDFFDDKIKIVTAGDKNKKNIVIFTSSYWEFFSLGEEFRKKNGLEINHYQLLEKILNDQFLIQSFNISVRWHPNLSSAANEEKEVINNIINKTTNTATHYKADNKINSYKLIENSDIVITFGSTVGVEATYYGKPSILLGVAYYEDTGSVYNPKNYKEFIKLLKSNLKPLPKIKAIKYGANEYYKGIKYLHVVRDQHHQWFCNGKNVLYQSILDKIKKLIRFYLSKIGILGHVKKSFSFLLYIIGKRKTKDMTPIKWLNSDI